MKWAQRQEINYEGKATHQEEEKDPTVKPSGEPGSLMIYGSASRGLLLSQKSAIYVELCSVLWSKCLCPTSYWVCEIPTPM